jgi:hypothetical protein
LLVVGVLFDVFGFLFFDMKSHFVVQAGLKLLGLDWRCCSSGKAEAPGLNPNFTKEKKTFQIQVIFPSQPPEYVRLKGRVVSSSIRFLIATFQGNIISHQRTILIRRP